MGRYGLLYGAYVSTRQIFSERATASEKAAVLKVRKFDGTYITYEYNPFDLTYQAVVARELKKDILRLNDPKHLHKVLFNSEHSAPVSYDSTTASAARDAGVLPTGKKMPPYERGVSRLPSGSNPADYCDRVQFANWYELEGNDGVVNRIAADTVRSVAPAVMTTTDPLSDTYAYGQYDGMSILQDWVRVHQAPRDPLSIAYRVERLKCHQRRQRVSTPTGTKPPEIWIGPQLGSKFSTGMYAAPADVFEEAFWLAAAFGARGFTCWGFDTIDWSSPLDRDTWSRVRKFRDTIRGTYPQILTATDAQRKVAVLCSKANQVLTRRAYYEIDDNYEHFYRILLTAHVPADILYDEDVLAGKLLQYKAVFLPGIEHSTPGLDAAIAAFQKAGGRVIRYPITNVPYRDYQITRGEYREAVDFTRLGSWSLLPHQYREWRKYHAAKVYALVNDLMYVKCDNMDVIVNLVYSGGKRYIILVNDKRTYGAWTTARRHKWCEDDGIQTTARVTMGYGSPARTWSVTLQGASPCVIAVD
jgi:hypothetical protein